MKETFRKLFCIHNYNEVICWHWTHGITANEVRFIEAQVKCSKCGKYKFIHIRDPRWYAEFTYEYKDKQWSDTCKPVL